MAAVQQRVLNWLYSVLTSEYQDVSRTYSDVAQTLSHYTSLTPRTEVFTYEHGASALLLNLLGTLPVTFRGTTYRFPISLWIPHAYPREAPLVYVTPADGMVIRAGQHVDPQGKVYHPYLVGWAEFWDKSNILDFLAILRDIFAKEPPVVSRQQRNPPIPSQQPASIPPPIPPHPPDIRASSSTVTISPDGPPRPPPPPPKPYDGADQSQLPGPSAAERRDTGPPLPPLPPGVARSPSWSQPLMASYQNSQQPIQLSVRYETMPLLPPQPSTQYFPPNSAPTAGPYGPQSFPQPTAGQNTTGPVPQSRSRAKIFPPAPVPQIQTYPGKPKWQQQPPIQPKAKIPPPPDLIDEPLTFPDPSENAAPLPAPPIPPNPEKDLLLHSLAQALYSRRQHSLSQTSSSLPSLRAQHTSMLTSLSSLNSEIHALESLSALLTSNTNILHTSLHEADSVIESSQGGAPPGVDEILVAPTVVGNQLYELVSEERSLGDALFVLSRAVERGRMGASIFAKVTRGLAREWYLKKALVKKIGKGMGLVTERRGYRR